MHRSIVVAIYLVGFTLLLYSGGAILGRVAEISVVLWWPMAVALLLQFATVFVAVRVWSLAVRISSGRVLSWREAAAHVCLNLVGKYVPGKIWGFAIRHRAMTAAGDTGRQAAGALAIEQSSMVLTACIMSVPASVAFIGTTETGLASAIIAVLAVVAFVLRDKVKRLISGLPSLHVAARVALLNGINWLMSGACLVLIAVGLGADIGFQESVLLASSVPAAVIGGMAAVFAPGGIGVREGIIVMLCAPILGAGPALGCALVLRIVSTVRDIACGFATPLLTAATKRASRQSL